MNIVNDHGVGYELTGARLDNECMDEKVQMMGLKKSNSSNDAFTVCIVSRWSISI